LINSDLTLINCWASQNCLLLNSSKSQAIIFGNKINYLDIPPIYIDLKIIPYSHSVRNLGLIMSSDLTWDNHINSICQKMFNTLRLMRSKCLGTPRATRLLLVKSLVLSHLFYCDIIFSKLKGSLMAKVTKIFNNCLRYIYDLRLYDHLSQFRNNIFGMPLQNYFNYRVTLFIFRSLHSSDTPNYIKDKFKFSLSNRTNSLILTTHKTTIMSDALTIRGAILWNRLPLDIRKSSSVDRFKKLCQEFHMSEIV